MNPVALHDALQCASLSLLHSEDRDRARAGTALLEASVAASEAFPPDSDGSRALGVILAAVASMASGAAL